jgi:hypothetical protein
MTIWRMRNSCCIPNATNTHSQYVIVCNAFPLYQSLHERVSVWRYMCTACLVVITATSVLRACNMFCLGISCMRNDEIFWSVKSSEVHEQLVMRLAGRERRAGSDFQQVIYSFLVTATLKSLWITDSHHRVLLSLYPTGVTTIFHWPNPSNCTMVPGSTQLLTQISTRDYLLRDKNGRCLKLTTLQL